MDLGQGVEKGGGATESAKLPIAGCLAAVGGLAILVALAYEAAPVERLDARIVGELSASPGSAVNFLASLFERFADWVPQVVLVALACLIALRSGRPSRAIVAVALVAGAALVTLALKVVLAHPRYQPILGDRQIAPTGFPSGHSAGALSMAFAFLFVVPCSWRRPTAAIAIGLAVVVSVSLIVLGLHYPSDVLAGWLVAIGWCFALLALRGAPVSLRRAKQ